MRTRRRKNQSIHPAVTVFILTLRREIRGPEANVRPDMPSGVTVSLEHKDSDTCRHDRPRILT